MIDFNQQVHKDTMVDKRYGRKGSPWEFNLRDVFRWAQLMQRHRAISQRCGLGADPNASPPSAKFAGARPDDLLDIVYLQRVRTANDRKEITSAFNAIFNTEDDQAYVACDARASKTGSRASKTEAGQVIPTCGSCTPSPTPSIT
jgi:midasin